MTSKKEPERHDDPPLTDDLLWGAEEIGAYLRRPAPSLYWPLQQGHIDADKVGRTWVTTKSRLDRQFQKGQGTGTAIHTRAKSAAV